MNIKKLFSTFAGITFILSSCGGPDGPSNNEPSKIANYWDTRTDAIDMGKKGKVKTITSGVETLTFNEAGNIVSTNNNTYSYDDKGRIIKGVTTFGTDNSSVTTYEYGNEGYYILESWHHPAQSRLIPGLSKIHTIERSSEEERVQTTLYKMENGILNIYDNDILVRSITYEGAYPVSFKTATDNGYGTVYGEFFEATYQANGMFDVATEGYYTEGPEPSLQKYTYYYKADDTFLLIEKTVSDITTSGSEPESELYTTTCTYNEQKDLVSEIAVDEHRLSGIKDTYTSTYSYVYDDHGNWIECHYVYEYDGNKNEEHWERTIEYYD